MIVFLAPFPRLLRYLIASSFFFVYQYAVVARPYVLLPLLAFGSAYLVHKGSRRVMALAAMLSLLAFVSIHGVVIAIALAWAFAGRLRPQWPEMDSHQRRWVIAATALFGFALALIAVIVFPPREQTYVLSDAQSFPLALHFLKMLAMLFYPFSESRVAGVAILTPVILWVLERGRDRPQEIHFSSRMTPMAAGLRCSETSLRPEISERCLE